MKGAKSLDGRKTPKKLSGRRDTGTAKGRGEERRQCDQGRSVNISQRRTKRHSAKKKKTILTFARQMLNVDISRPPDGIGADELPHQHGISPGDP
ncbi:hypothetical protein TNCV_904391 [Trichonephila clavipes]|nr:hypothetical protein TNCV_904321 [Trichonephila clavipes]GFV74007.1 hypothetical protein TNCV_904391 [Trichonephila clavipes]